jgi:hypothetical protein
MTSPRILVTLLVFVHIAFASCTPMPFSFGGRSRIRSNSSKIPVPELYQNLLLDDIPTTVAGDVFLSNCIRTRYGYHFGRPVDRITQLLQSSVGKFLKPVVGRFVSDVPSLLHWGILISNEPPYNSTERSPCGGSMVPRPETGIIFELRNSVNTGLIYLDVKNWETYIYQPEKVKYLGSLNRTDEELITIGRAYIQHVGREGFHNFYRNCQVFTSWYTKALWPKVTISARADQLLGKLLWWFKDWKKTAQWGIRKVKGFLGFRAENVEEVDSAAEFVEVENLLRQGSSPDGENMLHKGETG